MVVVAHLGLQSIPLIFMEHQITYTHINEDIFNHLKQYLFESNG